MKRRDFLKLSGVAGTLAMIGCGQQANSKLLPFINPPEDVVPGIPTWFASTCRQCPAGCGILAKSREARIVKFEGNPNHPVNKGKLCFRGQSGIQTLYSPDRLKGPMLKEGTTPMRVSWTKALDKFRAVTAESGGKVAVISGLEDGYGSSLLEKWAGKAGGGEVYYYEPINYEALRKGNKIVFGKDVIPAYDLSKADFLLSVDADFLETWLSPVELTRQFTQMRDFHGTKAPFIYAGPRLSMTAANADKWVALKPQARAPFLFAILCALVESGYSSENLPQIQTMIAGLSSASLAKESGLDLDQIKTIAKKIATAKTPLVLADGSADAAVAAGLINLLTGTAPKCMDFTRPHALSNVADSAMLKGLTDKIASGYYKMVVVHNSNPAYSLPGFAQAVDKAEFLVSIDVAANETSAVADLALPVHSPYESWGWYEPRKGLTSFVQPTMGPVGNSKPLETILAGPGEEMLPEVLHQTFVREAIGRLTLPFQGNDADFRTMQAMGFLNRNLADGGLGVAEPLGSYSYKAGKSEAALTMAVYPSLRWFDGRSANESWTLEIPDPMTTITWDDWLEMSPETAEAKGIEDGDLVEISTASGSSKLGVHIYPGLAEGTVALQMGLGRMGGNFSDGIGVNAHMLAGPEGFAEVTVSPTGNKIRFSNLDGSKVQHGREIVRVQYEYPHHDEDGEKGHGGHHTFPLRLPIASENDPKTSLYDGIEHKGYRWGMVIDLDKCTACSACVAACYAENNVATTGKQRHLEGREMSWIHIERYFEEGENPGIRFIPMLCQHCDSAPCESVCPVYAPHHNFEGLNVQIYNRCVGTRYCSQNCPYKVRRFNFYRYPRPEPLNMQLNPDVTVRSIGVMEKCSFCVQRIKAAHQIAKVEDRDIRDGEVMPACLQTCPAHAITFGNLLDPESEIRKLIKKEEGRAYQVLDELNTKPGVIYLKRIIREDKLTKV